MPNTPSTTKFYLQDKKTGLFLCQGDPANPRLGTLHEAYPINSEKDAKATVDMVTDLANQPHSWEILELPRRRKHDIGDAYESLSHAFLVFRLVLQKAHLTSSSLMDALNQSEALLQGGMQDLAEEEIRETKKL